MFGPLEFPRRDLMALNIQRGRDHGLPDYNSVRKAYGLEEMDFANFSNKNLFIELVRDGVSTSTVIHYLIPGVD